jgi:parallel beta-helix repeat protein
MAQPTTLQIATFGLDMQEGIAVGIRNFPVHKLVLICYGSETPDDGHTTRNRIYNNTVRNAENGIKVGNSNGNILANNTFENIESYEYLVSDGSEITIEDQHFTDDEISGGSGENTVTISNSGMITLDNDDDSEDDDNNNDAYDTDNDSYTVELSDDETVTVKSIK